MAGDLDRFERELRQTSRQLRRLPKELRQSLSVEVLPRVAVPLAGKIAGALAGPWARPLAGQVKARKLADPTIVIGGRRRLVRGGASGRQLIYGASWGGGKRVANVTRRLRRGGAVTYPAHVTAQFKGKGRDNVFPTIRRNGAWILEEFAGIVDEVLEQGMTRHG